MVSEEYFHTIFWVTFDIEMVYNSLSLKDHKQSCKFILDDIKKKILKKWHYQFVGAESPLIMPRVWKMIFGVSFNPKKNTADIPPTL